ncbi:MAG: sigma-70 family RNA polymerase sigma factor [Lachnospiraceae bacterium]|nr:sigma-70 family RNA polymerase sigma factor [Lachnospiraceae bacterium]
MDENKIIPYIEPIFRFCCKRLSNRYDAEDLSSEIICHILAGMKKYKIESFDAWVWRIAHNRYAKFIDARNKAQTILAEDETLFDITDSDYCYIDEESTEQEFEKIFRYLHTLSSEYRNIFIDYYIGEISIRMLSKKYSLPQTTIKWRLNVGRQKIKERIGENNMDKVYKRINWKTTCCNGSMDTDRYLHTQISRAICLAAYKKPLTIEEISISTGIPAMYIEDELPRLEYGDAVCKIGNKYATNFIIFGLKDRKDTEGVSGLLVKEIAEKFDTLLQNGADSVSHLSFYGHDFGMDRLGYILIPYILRRKIGTLKSKRLKLENGPFPPRKDGGYGWFIVEETVDENENCAEYNVGCNVTDDENGRISSHIYYYWISKYFINDIYNNKGICWLYVNGIPQNSKNGVVERGALSSEDAAYLIQNNLLVKSGDDYKLNFACFTEGQFEEFISLFHISDEHLDDLLAKWIVAVRKNFVRFVPARLEAQINQWVSTYLFQIVGYVIDELIRRGTLRKPDFNKPLTNGVFYVEGGFIDP